MKCLFQFLELETGARSEILEARRTEFARYCRDNLPNTDIQRFGVLVLMNELEKDGVTEMFFSQAPIFKLETFINYFGTEEYEHAEG